MSPTVVKNSMINNLKLYLFPGLISIISMMIWRDITELRLDVKQLLAESSSNKVKVENLQTQVNQLNQAVFKMPKVVADRSIPRDNKIPTDSISDHLYAIITRNDYLYDVKKYIPYKTN